MRRIKEIEDEEESKGRKEESMGFCERDFKVRDPHGSLSLQ